ncbi:MAG: LysM peptidoglycan-binding domain-containing protein [Bacteroidota bacterium]
MTRPLALLAALLVPLASVAQTPDVYVVRAGDTLFRISRAHGLTVEELRALNGLDGNAIEVGQPLRLSDRVPMPASDPVAIPPPEADPPAVPPAPAPGPEAAPASGTATHTVAAGETLFRIALRYDTTVEELRRINGIEGDRIAVGQRLRLPGGGSAAPPTATPAPGPVRLAAPERPWEIDRTTLPADLVHFVEPGETLYSIAAALDMRVDALTATNALSTAPLVPGTPLYLPEPVNPAVAMTEALPPVEDDGLALVFPSVMAGRATASGEAYDPEAFTASHREAPLGSVILVSNPATGRSTFARVIDRGPVSRAYLVELSAAAADLLGLDPDAAGAVEIRRVP